MSAKTDPFLPVPDLLRVTKVNLDVFASTDTLLMCQTRSVKAVEDPEVFDRLVAMARTGKVQPLRDVGYGATTPKAILRDVRSSVPHHERLAQDLVDGFDDPRFSWGVGNKGFVGAFLAAQRFYGASEVQPRLPL